MPFTFSHPAIVLPLTFLKRQWLSVTGLIVGSIIPDFEYFIRMKVQSNYSHTLLGLLWFDLPLGLLLCFIYHNIVRNSFIDNSPNFLKKRLSIYKVFNWTKYCTNNLFIVIISILTGASSHLLWDSFTHETGFFVTKLPALQNSIQLHGFTFPLFKLVQHLSSVVGGIIIVITICTLKKHPTTKTGINYKYWLWIITVCLTIIILRVLFGLNYKQYGNLIVTILSGGLIALIFTPLILKEHNYSQQ